MLQIRGAERRDALLLTGLSVLSQLLGFLYRVSLSRRVGAQVMGLYHLIMPVYSVLLSAASVGMTAAVSNLAARYGATGRSRALRQTLYRGLRLFFCVILPLSAAAAALYDPISVYFLGDARTQLGLLLLLPCAVLTGVENVHKHFFYGMGRVRLPALVELGEQLLRIAAVLGLLTLFPVQSPERALGLVVTGMIVCEVFSSVTLTVLGRRYLRRLGDTGVPEKSGALTRRVLSIAVPVGLNALLGNLMGAVNASAIPRYLVLSGMTRQAAVADFGVICGMTIPMLGLPCIFLGAMHIVVMPRVARSSALGDGRRLRRDVGRALEIVWAVVLPCMALMIVTGGELGRLLYHESRIGRSLAPLALATLCASLSSVLSGAVSAAGHPSISAGISIGCQGVQVLLTAITMGALNMGMEGFAAAVAVSDVLGLFLCGMAAQRHLRLSLRPGRRTMICALGTLLSWQTASLLYNCLARAHISGWPLVIGTLAFGCMIYLAGLFAMGWGSRKNSIDKSTQGQYNKQAIS